MLRLIQILLLGFFTNFLHGCILTRALITEELLLARGAGLRASATRIAVTEEALAMGNLSRLRIKSGRLKKPIVYLPENGVEKPLFEIINQSTIRRISSGEVFNLPFRIFKTNGLAKAELRNGPGITFDLYTTIPKNRLVLVRGEVKGWYQIQFDDVIGWIQEAAVSPSTIDDPELNVKYSPIDCYNCEGNGNNICAECNKTAIENCPSCQGRGIFICTHCNGKGHIACTLCDTKNRSGCPSCKGIGILDCGICKTKGHFDCNICHTTGKIPCAVCDGTLHTKCFYCYGTGRIIARRCEQ